MATATRADEQVAQRCLAALDAGDWSALGSLLADGVQLRSLVCTGFQPR
ncbi:MAG TPA: hypothetical protein VLD13_05985 [Gaiellaceae bacterium]|nr:hypothetical protein [Gaiellaceae bacterium]